MAVQCLDLLTSSNEPTVSSAYAAVMVTFCHSFCAGFVAKERE